MECWRSRSESRLYNGDRKPHNKKEEMSKVIETILYVGFHAKKKLSGEELSLPEIVSSSLPVDLSLTALSGLFV